jgi:disulfide oxidoreductase YuzD
MAMYIVGNTTHAQIVEPQIIYGIDSICTFIVQDNTMKEIIERVLPNVKFEYRMNTKRGWKGLVYICRGSTYSEESFNKLLLDIKYLEDSTRSFSNEDLIKSYMYLGIASGQTTNAINFPLQFNISGARDTYIGELDDYYKRIGFSNRDLYYHAEASWS